MVPYFPLLCSNLFYSNLSYIKSKKYKVNARYFLLLNKEPTMHW